MEEAAWRCVPLPVGERGRARVGLVGREEGLELPVAVGEPGAAKVAEAKLSLATSGLTAGPMDGLGPTEELLPWRRWWPKPKWRRCWGEGGASSSWIEGGLTRTMVSLQEVARDGFMLSSVWTPQGSLAHMEPLRAWTLDAGDAGAGEGCWTEGMLAEGNSGRAASSSLENINQIGEQACTSRDPSRLIPLLGHATDCTSAQAKQALAAARAMHSPPAVVLDLRTAHDVSTQSKHLGSPRAACVFASMALAIPERHPNTSKTWTRPFKEEGVPTRSALVRSAHAVMPGARPWVGFQRLGLRRRARALKASRAARMWRHRDQHGGSEAPLPRPARDRGHRVAQTIRIALTTRMQTAPPGSDRCARLPVVGKVPTDRDGPQSPLGVNVLYRGLGPSICVTSSALGDSQQPSLIASRRALERVFQCKPCTASSISVARGAGPTSLLRSTRLP
ncbi:hypothetical protein HETIRDRAFT_104349 [Heterobasidion irregulare TC 32-1]|uniref:Uncharacterized protein n=1 Tax=Heterobasidion irregulare (strain TC 32-1) TaxID=747525 RepID=W4JZY0_HETIT|nr:uncharacterized protein HETIRDRAFT_104349 [Heterobasidion irregulare TC 32-1]ETW79034.1 hypothetical protein HETIRDRAFT_104349 [Heterobasidion irregulare TC 32-1]